MHTLKTLLIVAVLSAVAYGVYVMLTGTPDSEPPPGVAEEGYDSAPKVELPPATKAAKADPGPSTLTAAAPKSLGEAPAYVPKNSTRDDGSAPPFVSPRVGPQTGQATGDAPPGAYPDTAPDARNLDTRYPSTGISPPSAEGNPAAGPVDPAPCRRSGRRRQFAHQLSTRRPGRRACGIRRGLSDRSGDARPRQNG